MRISVLMLFILLSVNLFATDYYCNPNGGNNSNNGTSEGSALAGLSSATSVLASKGLSNGDTIYLMDGNHGAVSIVSLNFTSYVTIKILSGQTSAYLKSVLLTNSNYWAFDGVKIDGTGNINPNTDPSGGLEYLFRTDFNSNNIKIVNCLIQSADNVDSWTKADWYQKVLNGIWIRGHHAIVENNVIQNIYHAIEIGIYADDSQVNNNLIDNFAADGIRGLGNRCTYEYNIVQNCYINDYDIQHDDAFQCYGVDASTYKRSDITLRNNKFLLWNKALPTNMDIIGDLMQGIINTDGHADNWIIENNLVVNNQGHGISVYGGINCKIQNNTIIRSPIYPYNNSKEPRLYVDDQGKSGQEQANGNNIIRSNITTMLTTWTLDASSTVEGNIDIVADNIANLRAIFNDYDNNDFYPSLTGVALDSGINTDLYSTDLAGNPRLVDGNNNGTAIVDVGCYEYGVDSTPPTFTVSDTYSSTQLTLVYSETVTQSTAENTSNYSLDGGISVQTASLDADGITLTITTSVMVAATYTVTINGVEDLNGNTISNASDDFIYECNIISASSYQDDELWGTNPPQDAFDDDMDTKWAADGVGEWIQKSYCDTEVATSIDIAFSLGDARTYNFEILSSDDGITFTSLGNYTSAGNTLAKENFDIPDTSEKILKIVGGGNSVNSWNNYVEIVVNRSLPTVPTTVVIIASINDGYVSELGDVVTDNHMKVGRSDATGSNFTSAIIPFQLPAIPNGYTQVEGAVLNIYVPYGREFVNTSIDLYGLQYKLENTNGVISASDYYTGTFGDRSTDVAIEEDLFSKSNPIGVLDYSRKELSVNQQELSDYINAQYTAGAVAGDWVFLRLTVNNTSATGNHYFAIDGADGSSIDFSGITRDNSIIKPAELHINFANSIDMASTTIWDGISWSNGVPDQNSDVVINGDLALGSDVANDIDKIISKSLVINTGNDVTINVGGTIVVEDTFTVQGDVDILVESGGSFIAKDATLISFDTSSSLTIKREANSSIYNYTYWSSPVSTTVELALLNTGSPVVYQHETSNYILGDNSTEWQVATGNMIPGRGYISKSSSSNSPVVQTAEFTTNQANGINHKSVILPMSFGTEANSDPYGWNLIGNPYPSALSGHAFLQENYSNIVVGGALCFWTHNTSIYNGDYSQNDYAYYNFSGGTTAISGGAIPDGKIASGQAFFVEANDVSMTFNPDFQIVSNNGTYNNRFYKTNSNKIDDINIDRVWFNVFNENAFSQILVGFFEEASSGIDNLYDAKRIDVGNNISFYSIVEDNYELAIQGKASFVGNETIVLGFDANIDFETNFFIDIENIEGNLQNSDISVILKDKYLGVSHNLKKSNYQFSVVKSGKYNDRFEIYFLTGTLGNNEVNAISDIEIFPNPVETKFSLKSNKLDIDYIKIYNSNGVVVKDFNYKSEFYYISELPPGVYVLSVLLKSGEIFKKKIIKKI